MKIIPFKRVNLHLPKVAFSSYDLVWEEFILTKYPTNYSVYNEDFLFYSIAITITLVNVFYVLQEV
jgi:hypothetical protein